MTRGSAARVMVVWSPDWPVTAAARVAGTPADRPAAVLVANRVLACSAVARARGVRRGLRRREAQARCPDLVVMDRDVDRDARLFEPVVVAVEELAPGVEVVRAGLVALPARGPAGFFGGERFAAERLVDRVAARTGVECQVGVADGLFAAVLAARRGLLVDPGTAPAFLAPLGVSELDREPDVDRAELVSLLHRLGLRSLGAFGALAAADVASRFGADAVLAHRLARGLDPRPPVRRVPPEDLAVQAELDPPVDRVDAAAFAARALAQRLHTTLAGHGLSGTRLGVEARTEAGEVLRRVWRCAEPLTPAGTADRVRWQLDAWLTRGGCGTVGWLRLVPEETVAAGALQRGLWGDVGEDDERAGRALVRVQALLGPDTVVTAVLGGGRDPAERVRLVAWGDERGADEQVPVPAHSAQRVRDDREVCASSPAEDDRPGPGRAVVDTGPSIADRPPAGWPQDVLRAGGWPGPSCGPGYGPGSAGGRRRPPPPRAPGRVSGRPPVADPPASWPGRLPAPSPATVPPEPLPALLRDAAGRPVALSAPDLLDAAPATLAVDRGEPRAVTGWAGPWPVWSRWWAEGAPGSRVQVGCDDGTAWLLLVREGRWWVIGIYD